MKYLKIGSDDSKTPTTKPFYKSNLSLTSSAFGTEFNGQKTSSMLFPSNRSSPTKQ